MKRRDFLGMGLAQFVLAAPVHAAAASPMSRAAQIGMFPNVPLITHRGEKVRFYDDLIRDRTVLLNFFLVECSDALCPTVTANLRKVQDLLGPRMGRDIFFYSITLKPRHDTPKVLKRYAADYGIGPGWRLLTGKPADIERIRLAQGFVDSDPKRDRDLNLHTVMGRYGNDRLDRWGGISLGISPESIASTFDWLTEV
ncbi:MAG: SCO family protein [Betaproteobacteria bacterium]|nr:SCO family protein [Betaproteobacteria bacterium]MBI2959932.1 SCO family protein [Betaproteobacteria bacterium]